MMNGPWCYINLWPFLKLLLCANALLYVKQMWIIDLQLPCKYGDQDLKGMMQESEDFINECETVSHEFKRELKAAVIRQGKAQIHIFQVLAVLHQPENMDDSTPVCYCENKRVKLHLFRDHQNEMVWGWQTFPRVVKNQIRSDTEGYNLM